MSEAVAKKNQSPVGDLVRLTVTLMAIAAVCALLLGLVNEFTKDRIAAVEADKKAAAMAAVLPADSYTPVDYTGGDATINEIQKAGDAGWVIQVSPGGSFSGTLTIMVGVNSDLTVSGVEIVKSSETSGLGANAKKPAFRAQFVGKSGVVAVTKDGGDIDALTGATITSRAVSAGVTSALAAAAALG